MTLPLDDELKIIERTGREVIGFIDGLAHENIVPLEVWISPDPTLVREEAADERPGATREVRYYALRPEHRVRLMEYIAERLTQQFGWREPDYARSQVSQALAYADRWRALARRVVALLYLNRAELPAGGYLEQAASRFLADAAVDGGVPDPFFERRMNSLEGEIAEFQATHSRLHRHGFRILEQVGHAINALTRPQENYTWDERKDSALLHLGDAKRYLLEPPDTQPSDAPGAIRTPDDPWRGERAAYRRLDGVLRERIESARSLAAHLRNPEGRGIEEALRVAIENLDEALADLGRVAAGEIRHEADR